MPESIVEAIACVATETPRRTLTQLCKHFAHRCDVAYEGDRGSIMFPIGICLLDSGNGALTLRARAADAEKLAQLQDVVGRHLLRFAFRQPPEIAWRPGSLS